MCVSLGVVFMVIGGFFDVLDLSASALASLLVVFVYIEIGSPYTYLVWLATSLATFVTFPGSVIWIEYLAVFGIYPILKAYIERRARILWLPIKLIYVNAVLWGMILAVEKLLKIPFFNTDLMWVKAGIYILLNVAFIAYDMFLTVFIRLYFNKLRHRFMRFLK